VIVPVWYDACCREVNIGRLRRHYIASRIPEARRLSGFSNTSSSELENHKGIRISSKPNNTIIVIRKSTQLIFHFRINKTL
jgi:hypothetical protein